MALPTLTKTWQFNVNNAQAAQGGALPDNRKMWRAIKDVLIGFATTPWTIGYSSGGGVAGSANDGVDRWTSDTNLTWTTTLSWMVLKQSGLGSGQLLISLPSSVNGSSINFVYSPSAGFTGGSTAARPTATDEIAFSGIQSGPTVDVAMRWSVMQSTDGQVTRIFTCFSGFLNFWLQIEKGANATGGSPGATNSGFFFVTGSNTAAVTPGLLGTTRQNGTNCVCAIDYNSNLVLGIASEVTGQWDTTPIVVGSTTTVGTRGILFNLQDIWVASNNALPTGDTAPATGSPAAQFAIIKGNVASYVIPWNNGAFNLS
jgi:hypothetical protein